MKTVNLHYQLLYFMFSEETEEATLNHFKKLISWHDLYLQGRYTEYAFNCFGGESILLHHTDIAYEEAVEQLLETDPELKLLLISATDEELLWESWNLTGPGYRAGNLKSSLCSGERLKSVPHTLEAWMAQNKADL